jgi:hypothetical protein
VEVHTGADWELADPSLASRLPFDRLWFGRSFGQFLSYGDKSQQGRVYEDMMAWAQEGGNIVGAMSAPLKFVAAVNGHDASVTPVVSVEKTEDLRWIGAAGSPLAILAAAYLLERGLKKKTETSGR